MCICVCENKQKAESWRVLSTTRYAKKESVRRFQIGRDKRELQPVCRMQNREKKEVAQFNDVLLECFFLYSIIFFCYYKSLLYARKTELLCIREIIINASTHTWTGTLVFLSESWWNELALRRKRVEKKAAMTLPSAGERRVTSNQNSDEDWLVDDDVTCGMSERRKT